MTRSSCSLWNLSVTLIAAVILSPLDAASAQQKVIKASFHSLCSRHTRASSSHPFKCIYMHMHASSVSSATSNDFDHSTSWKRTISGISVTRLRNLSVCAPLAHVCQYRSCASCKWDNGILQSIVMYSAVKIDPCSCARVTPATGVRPCTCALAPIAIPPGICIMHIVYNVASRATQAVYTWQDHVACCSLNSRTVTMLLWEQTGRLHGGMGEAVPKASGILAAITDCSSRSVRSWQSCYVAR